MTRPTIDLLDLKNFQREGQPYQLFAWLRANDPVHWHTEEGGPGFWAVTRYNDILRVSRDPATFSSWMGGVHVPNLNDAALAGVRNMMLYMDPPEQLRYRLLVRDGFTPRRARSLIPRVQALAREIVNDVVERGECDFVTDIAGKLPSYLIAELIGIPLEHGRMLYDLTERMHSTDNQAVPPKEREMARIAMLDYGKRVASEKRANPSNDIGSVLAHAQLDGERLSDEEFAWFFLLLVNAGGDTTRNLVAGGMHTLFEHDPQRDLLQSNLEELLPSAVEEMLRFCSPVVHFRRTATKDVQLGGQLIREGEKVVMFYGSGNRDETVFSDPDEFDVFRTPNEHIAFGGGGPHFCLGAHIARVEARAMFGEVLSRLADIRQSGPVVRFPSSFIAGPQHLPVMFTPGPRIPVDITDGR